MDDTSRSLHDRIEKARQAGAAYATATTRQQAAEASAAIQDLLKAPHIPVTISITFDSTQKP